MNCMRAAAMSLARVFLIFSLIGLAGCAAIPQRGHHEGSYRISHIHVTEQSHHVSPETSYVTSYAQPAADYAMQEPTVVTHPVHQPVGHDAGNLTHLIQSEANMLNPLYSEPMKYVTHEKTLTIVIKKVRYADPTKFVSFMETDYVTGHVIRQETNGVQMSTDITFRLMSGLEGQEYSRELADRLLAQGFARKAMAWAYGRFSTPGYVSRRLPEGVKKPKSQREWHQHEDTLKMEPRHSREDRQQLMRAGAMIRRSVDTSDAALLNPY